MTNKKELEIKELDKVNGGYYASGQLLNMDFEERVLGQYETENYIGKEVVIFSVGDHMLIACGTLIDSYEKTSFCGTRRYVKLALNPNYKFPYGEEDSFCVDNYSDYECHLVIRYY